MLTAAVLLISGVTFGLSRLRPAAPSVDRATVWSDDTRSGSSTASLFKLTQDGSEASRVNVTLGRSSVNTVEIKERLQVGDRVILSDMSQWDNNVEFD